MPSHLTKKWRRSGEFENLKPGCFGAIGLNSTHRYLLLKEARRYLPHCLSPAVARWDAAAFVLPAESVTLHLRANASPFCRSPPLKLGVKEAR